MKKTNWQIGYIAGILERRGAIDRRENAERGFEIAFGTLSTLKKVQSIMGGKQLKRSSLKAYKLYVPINDSIGWMMTTYSLVSIATKEKFEQAILSWKARGSKFPKRLFALCHPEKQHKAQGLCEACYKRKRRGALYVDRHKWKENIRHSL